MSDMSFPPPSGAASPSLQIASLPAGAAMTRLDVPGRLVIDGEGPMDHFVTLDKLPENLEFPGDLKDRIWIDPASRKLFYRGYMSKIEFDRISSLTRDWAFRRKLEELFQISIQEDEP